MMNNNKKNCSCGKHCEPLSLDRDNKDNEIKGEVCECHYSETIPDSIIDMVTNAISIEDFEAGVKEYSNLCGKISALFSVGIEPSQALAYISECEDRDVTYRNNIDIAKMQTDAQVTTAKCGMAASLS